MDTVCLLCGSTNALACVVFSRNMVQNIVCRECFYGHEDKKNSKAKSMWGESVVDNMKLRGEQ